MWNWIKLLFALSDEEKNILYQIRRWPKGSFRVTRRSISIDPKVVNQLPETKAAREEARKIVERHNR